MQQRFDDAMLESSFLSCISEKLYSPVDFCLVKGRRMILAECVSELVACMISRWFGVLHGAEQSTVEMSVRVDNVGGMWARHGDFGFSRCADWKVYRSLNRRDLTIAKSRARADKFCTYSICTVQYCMSPDPR